MLQNVKLLSPAGFYLDHDAQSMAIAILRAIGVYRPPPQVPFVTAGSELGRRLSRSVFEARWLNKEEICIALASVQEEEENTFPPYYA